MGAAPLGPPRRTVERACPELALSLSKGLSKGLSHRRFLLAAAAISRILLDTPPATRRHPFQEPP